MTLEQILTIVLSLGGVAAFIAALINTGKAIGLVQDGQAPTYSLLANVVLFVAVAILGVFAPATDLGSLDGIAKQLSEILVLVLGLATQLGLTKNFAEWLKGLPIVGYSHSDVKGEVDTTIKVVNNTL